MECTVFEEVEVPEMALWIHPDTFKQLREGYIHPKTGKVGLSQKALAAILGVTESAVKKYESKTDPSIPQSPVLAKMMILYDTELFFSKENGKKHPALIKMEEALKAELKLNLEQD